MKSNVIFVGGIHGVGKSTICRRGCSELNLRYLSASDLIKWEDISVKGNKLVSNISNTQERLIEGLRHYTGDGKNYLLDGHFSLLKTDHQVEVVPVETFLQINPSALFIVTDDIAQIKKRLEDRDGKIYSYNMLKTFQAAELEHAKNLSKTLGISLSIFTVESYDEFISSLHHILV